MPDAASSTQEAVAALWERNVPQVLERLALLERAAGAAGVQGLEPGLRDEALSVAHKLAGSLGMFGFQEGTRLARELELELEAAVVDTGRLAWLTVELRTALFPK